MSMPKLMAKMYRMRMLSDVRELVGSLPFEVVEKQLDSCVYAGDGEVNTGTAKYSTSIQIVRNDFGKLMIVMKAPKAGIREEIPFDTEDQRKRAPELIKAAMIRYLN